MIDDYRVLDADAHVVEPPAVFDQWVDRGSLPADLPPDTPMVPCGDLDLVADQIANRFDPPSYLRAMDAQGIDAAVVYPSLGLFVPYLPALDATGSSAACRSYNEWVAGWCAHAPGRLAAVGLVPLADPELAADEVARAAALGLVGVLVRPNHLYGRNLGDPAYDALWSTCSEHGLVAAVHEGLGLAASHPTIGADRFGGFAARHALSHPMEQMAAMASLVLDGALERHPELRVAFLESGTGWLPYWLHRLDEHREWLQPGRPAATELFARQCVISSEAEDVRVGGVIDHVGAGHVLWASDFPHPDAVFPDSARTFVGRLRESEVAHDDIATVLWDAPARFYRLADRFG